MHLSPGYHVDGVVWKLEVELWWRKYITGVGIEHLYPCLTSYCSSLLPVCGGSVICQMPAPMAMPCLPSHDGLLSPETGSLDELFLSKEKKKV